MAKRIGLLTSGGDCAGLNAAIRAVVMHARNNHGFEVFGIYHGTNGLVNRPFEYIDLGLKDVDSFMLRSGGTVLGSTNKDNPFKYRGKDGEAADRSNDIIDAYHQLGFEALICIGGDGSMRIMDQLAKQGNLNMVYIPKTIDNDLAETESAIGFHTAVSIATEAADRLQTTAYSHQRVMVLEVMGRDAGHIALHAGVAGGADVILMPEFGYNLDKVCEKIKSLYDIGRRFSLVVVAEAVRKENGEIVTKATDNDRPRYGGVGQYLAEKIAEKTGFDSRFVALGHAQRGGSPVAQDRTLASSFGVAAVDLVVNKKFGRMVALQNHKVVSVSIDSVSKEPELVKKDNILLHTAKGLGIYVGEF